MTHIITRKDFLAYAKTKSGSYDYCNNQNCAIAQYGREVLGLDKPYARAGHLENDGKIVAVYDWEDEIPENILDHSRNGALEKWSIVVRKLKALS